MQEQAAWVELLDTVKNAVPQPSENFRWLAPNRVAFLKRWQVQARFVKEPHRSSVHFERFGAELGHVNYEPTPGVDEPKHTVLTMLVEISNGEAFWRLADGRTIKSDALAQWVIERLPLFHEEYGNAALGLGC